MTKSYTQEEYLKIINAFLLKELDECEYNEPIVCEAMKYSVKNGGKRVRPMLTLEFCRVCGGDIESALPLACAVEFIHTYSLIHDDLPCMDDDDMRRGNPSCHIKFGESYALLAGDALLTHAFRCVSRSEFAKKNPALALEAVEVLSSLSGINGMIGGQVVDLQSEGKQISLETLETMDRLKTGALIKAACLLGVIAAGGKTEDKKAAEVYASNIGHAFQIVDDILDVTADEKEFGKPVGSDKESGKSTYVSILGLEKSQQIADKLTERAVKSLEIFKENSEFLKEFAFKLASRKK